MTKKWTSVEDWFADPYINIKDTNEYRNCRYPSCLIWRGGEFRVGCAHGCPFEKDKGRENLQ
jgi:hypothetical protein